MKRITCSFSIKSTMGLSMGSVFKTCDLAMIGVVLTVFFNSCSKPTMTPERMKEMIAKELRTSSSVTDVLAFLDSKSISHSGYYEGVEYKTEDSIDGYRVHEVRNRIINASVHDVERRLLVKYGIYIRFFFDEHQQVTHYEVVKLRSDP